MICSSDKKILKPHKSLSKTKNERFLLGCKVYASFQKNMYGVINFF